MNPHRSAPECPNGSATKVQPAPLHIEGVKPYRLLLRGDLATLWVIYGLIDPREPAVVRYVGKSMAPGSRLCSHIDNASSVSQWSGKKDQWIYGLLGAGLAPDMVLLEEAAHECRGRELHWLNTLRAIGQADLNTVPPADARDFPIDNRISRAPRAKERAPAPGSPEMAELIMGPVVYARTLARTARRQHAAVAFSPEQQAGR